MQKISKNAKEKNMFDTYVWTFVAKNYRCYAF